MCELVKEDIPFKKRECEVEDALDIFEKIEAWDRFYLLKYLSIPKVTIYNFYGDKVTSVKPELLNGNYSFKVDMSNKQHGTYYIHIVSKDSSITATCLYSG